MDYLKLFQNHSEYETFVSGGTMMKPNVSHCVSENEVHYNPHTFADEYFTTVALESGTISFNIWQSMGTDMINSISYSTDNGETWTTTNNTNNKSENIVITVNVSEGDKVMWKGDATQLGYMDNDSTSYFTSTGRFNVIGNIMSLLYGKDFVGNNTLTNGCFYWLFSGLDDREPAMVVDASKLVLPATTLAYGCYNSMFSNCTSLTKAPELPATTLADNCYSNMFYGCTNLVNIPSILPATTLTYSCYYNMFSNCTSLTTVPELPATTLAEGCYQGMFEGCTSLVTTPELSATTLAERCYSEMFSGCTSLTTAHELPATTLASNCYLSMFSDCTSLTTAPQLPATTLARYCYWSMFYGCTSLTTAPVLPAKTMAWGCYRNMFNGCSNLNYIKCLATYINVIECTDNWVNGVASSGTFTKAASMSSWTTGANGIPTNWTVQDAS